MASDWEYFDAYATFLERDTAREAASGVISEQAIGRSGGFHPGPGEYIVDPDYMELLGCDSFEQLIRRQK